MQFELKPNFSIDDVHSHYDSPAIAKHSHYDSPAIAKHSHSESPAIAKQFADDFFSRDNPQSDHSHELILRSLVHETYFIDNIACSLFK